MLLVLVTGLFAWLLRPFFGALFWACVIGILFYPLHRYLSERLGHRPTLAALVTLVICAIVVIVPALFVIGSFFQEGLGLYQRLQSGDLDPGAYVDRVKAAFPVVQNILERAGIDLNEVRKLLADAAIAASRLIAQNAVDLGQGTAQFFLHLGLLFAKFSEVTRATVKGTLVVAIVQGTLGGLIFWVLGIPGALLWGVVMTVLSLIPVVGAGLIWAPVAIYLFAVGDWVQGLILAAFGIGVIGLVDNLLRPVLVGRDTKLPDYIVLLSTLGGLALFGMNGFVIGPLIAALFVTFWEIFIREFNTPSESPVCPPSMGSREPPGCQDSAGMARHAPHQGHPPAE